MHSEWRYAWVFTSVSSSRQCWSLDLVRMCLFVMSIFTPPTFCCCCCFVFFSIWFSHEVFFFFFPVWAETNDNENNWLCCLVCLLLLFSKTTSVQLSYLLPLHSAHLGITSLPRFQTRGGNTPLTITSTSPPLLPPLVPPLLLLLLLLLTR